MKMNMHERGNKMKQIRLNEMTYEEKLQYAEPQIKKGTRISYTLIWGIPLGLLFALFIFLCILCIIDEEILFISIDLLGLLCISLVLLSALSGNKILKNSKKLYDEIIDHRVWSGCIDNFQLHLEYEFVDKNGQSITKTFTDKIYEKYENQEKVYVIYIPENDVWYMETKEIFH